MCPVDELPVNDGDPAEVLPAVFGPGGDNEHFEKPFRRSGIAEQSPSPCTRPAANAGDRGHRVDEAGGVLWSHLVGDVDQDGSRVRIDDVVQFRWQLTNAREWAKPGSSRATATSDR